MFENLDSDKNDLIKFNTNTNKISKKIYLSKQILINNKKNINNLNRSRSEMKM
jgi:hypothetical protein